MNQNNTGLGMEAFFTRERANEGVEVPLYTPDGTKSQHWIRIRGVDSDAFREAEANSKRDAFRVASIEDTVERAKAIARSAGVQRHLVLRVDLDAIGGSALTSDIAVPKDRPYIVLGTDGFGRSDFRARLREHFEVDRHYIAVAALKGLADAGALPRQKVADAIRKYGIDTEKINPLHA